MGRTPNEDGQVVDSLVTAHDAYERRDWDDAYLAYAAGDALQPLAWADLERLATTASLSGRDDVFFSVMERLYHGYCGEGRCASAARSAFWLFVRLMPMGEAARAGAWLERARRLVERLDADCAEAALLSIPDAQRALAGGDSETAVVAATRAIGLGERHGEGDAVAMGRNLLGRALLRRGEAERGLVQLDEAMLCVTAGELSPAFAGVVYCQVIASYQQVYALDRARQWTRALTAFCDAQPQLVPFTGTCLVHQAEIFELGGEWGEAIDAVQRCAERSQRLGLREGVGEAHYRKGEIERLRGDLEDAELSYEAAAQRGREPLPGLALLRLAQGAPERAIAALRSTLASIRDPLARMGHLPALIEACLAAGQEDLARETCEEVQATARAVDTEMLRAIAAEARGMCLLSSGDASLALTDLRGAFNAWQRADAPYRSARLRVLIAAACDALGDAEGARLERAAARRVFEGLGAHVDLAALGATAASSVPPSLPVPLTGAAVQLSPREREVLTWLATGATNRAIAHGLGVSEKTIDRHVSNLFEKLDVHTRAAATAYAFAHGLVGS